MEKLIHEESEMFFQSDPHIFHKEIPNSVDASVHYYPGNEKQGVGRWKFLHILFNPTRGDHSCETAFFLFPSYQYLSCKTYVALRF